MPRPTPTRTRRVIKRMLVTLEIETPQTIAALRKGIGPGTFILINGENFGRVIQFQGNVVHETREPKPDTKGRGKRGGA